MSRNHHWARMGEHTFVGGIWLLYWLHRALGRTIFRLAMYPVVLVYWLLLPRLRANSRQYLQRLQQATGALGRPAGHRDSLKHVALFAETMLDKLLAMAGRYPWHRVQVEGTHELDALIAGGQGGVIVTAHLGCLELCQVLAERRHQFRLNVLVHTRHAEQFNRLLRRLHPDSAVQLLEVTAITPFTAAILADKVAAGEWVAIAGDRVPVTASKSVLVDFLGHPAPFPVGPYVLAGLLRCPLFLLGCIHEGAGYRIHVQKLAAQVALPRTQRDAALQRYAGEFASVLTCLLTKSPYDWFNFFPFWDQTHAAHPTRS